MTFLLEKKETSILSDEIDETFIEILLLGMLYEANRRGEFICRFLAGCGGCSGGKENDSH
jgi:hypothetical protein